MTVVCPVCKGEGKAIRNNGVDPQKKDELHTCWMCAGTGKIEEVRHEEKIHITKYHGVMAG